MEKLLNLIISGAVAGGLFSLIAAGLTLTYNATGIFNFGYGAVAFTSAFLYYELNTGLHWSIVPAAVVTILVFAPLLGLVLDRLIFRNLTRATDSAKIMATVGILVALPALAEWIVGLLINDAHVSIPTGDDVFVAPGIGPTPPDAWHLGSLVDITSDQVIVFAAAAGGALLLWLLLRHTSLGLKMRALVDRPNLAQLRGVNRARTSGIAWILGTTIAGLVGVIGAPIFNSLAPSTYELIMFIAVAAAVFGGLRSIPLAFAGGLIVGVLQNLVAGYATFAKSITGFNAAVPFAVLLIGLLFLGRDRARRANVASEEIPVSNYLADLPAWRRALPWAVALGALLAYLLWLASPFWTQIVTEGLALGIVFLSFTLLTGVGGMVSLAQAAFVTTSGLTAGLLIVHFHQPYLVGLLGGVVAAVVVGLVVALPALRLGGLSLALATLALGFLCDEVLFQWSWFRNSYYGWTIPRPRIGPLNLGNERTFALVLLALVLLVCLLIRNLQCSPSGRAMFAVRSSEVAAATSGISPWAVKLMIFALSAALAGLGGVLLVTVDQSAVGSTYTTSVGLTWLASVVVWGVRRPAAAVVGGLSFALFPALLSQGFQWPSWVPSFLSWDGTKSVWIPSIIFGMGAIQMAKDPDGVLSVFGKARAAKRARRTEQSTRPDAVVSTRPGSTARVPAAPATPAVPTTGATGGVLRVRGVDAGYESVRVLRGVDLDVPGGAITALLGANGAGKSTLCSVVSGLLPVTAGTVLFHDEDVTKLRPDERANRGLILTPESRGIFPGLTVDENLSLTMGDVADRDLAYQRFPSLADRRRLPAGNLSGGEQQMLTLVSQLVHPPAMLVADEPTLGLAPRVVEDISRIFCELRQMGVALLLVEEKARAVLEIADQVTFLELGRVVWAGPRADVTGDQLRASYLGVNSRAEGISS